MSPVVSCNMYQNVGAMWGGFVKWMYSVAALSPVALIGLIVAGYVFFLAPFYWLWDGLFAAGAQAHWLLIVVVQVTMILLMRWLVDHHFKEPVVSAFLHPIGFSFLFLTAAYASARQAIGKGISWKDRLYSAASGVK